MLENSLDYFNRISDITIDSFYCRNGEDFIELNHRLTKLNMSANFDAINKLCKLNIKNFNKNLDLASKVAEKF
jgi:hypothetical protein